MGLFPQWGRAAPTGGVVSGWVALKMRLEWKGLWMLVGNPQATTRQLLRADLGPCARGNETIEGREINDGVSVFFTGVFR